MVELNEKALEVGQRVEKYTGEARWFGTILSTYITGRGKVRHVVEVEPQGFQMIAVPEQLRPDPALPASDDGLVERETHLLDWLPGAYDHCQNGSREWCETYLTNAVSVIRSQDAALQSQAEQIERLTRERDVALENYTRAWNERDAQRRRAEDAGQQVQKLTAENERLREAMEPFAKVAEHDIGEDEDDADIFWPISNARYSMAGRLRVGHLRAARSALETQEGRK